MWSVEYDPDFKEWLGAQPYDVRKGVAVAVVALQVRGPQLDRPYCDLVKGSAFPNLKELRVKVDRRPYRVLFAFDPRRSAILLVGGDKGSDARWYKVNVPIADARYRRHLANLKP